MSTAVQVKERPILFSAPMVRAILEERKTQTRRVAKFVPTKLETGLNIYASSLSVGDYFTGRPELGKVLYSMRGACWNQVTERLFCPYGKPGDHLWVRETWGNMALEGYPEVIAYRADPDEPEKGWGLPPGMKWKPAIHMKRIDSRITLDILSVRVERIQDISEEDCVAEGIEPIGGDQSFGWNRYSLRVPGGWKNFKTAKEAFRELWDSINGKRTGLSWADNPWVWAIEFRRISPGASA